MENNGNYLTVLQLMFFWLIKLGIFTTLLLLSLALEFTFFRAYFKKLFKKNIEYRNFKNFYKDYFLHELGFELGKGTFYKFKDNQYDTSPYIFRMVLEKHDPIKSKITTGDRAAFMSEELTKAIKNRI